MTNNNSLYKLGAICSIGAGMSYLAFTAFNIVDPILSAGRAGTGTPQMMLAMIAEGGTAHYLFHIAFALTGLFLLGVIPGIQRLLGKEAEGWVMMASILGYLAFGVTALTHLAEPQYEVIWAKAFATGDAATQAALMQIMQVSDIDPLGWFMTAAAGIWFFTVHWVALRQNAWPRTLAYLGLAAGFVYWGLFFGRLLQITALADIAGLLGGAIIGPIVTIWLGLELNKKSGAAATTTPETRRPSTAIEARLTPK